VSLRKAIIDNPKYFYPSILTEHIVTTGATLSIRTMELVSILLVFAILVINILLMFIKLSSENRGSNGSGIQEKHRTRRIVTLPVVMTIAMMLVTVAIVYPLVDSYTAPPKVQITDISCKMTYTTPWYLPYAVNYMDVVTSGPVEAKAGSTFEVNVVFTSHADALTHKLDSITISPDTIALVSVSPVLPSEELFPGSSLNVTLTLRAPNVEYTGGLIINAAAS